MSLTEQSHRQHWVPYSSWAERKITAWVLLPVTAALETPRTLDSWSLPPRSLTALDSEHSSPVLHERAALWLQAPRERKQVALSPAEGHLTTFPFCSHISTSNSLGGRHSAWPCGLSNFPLGAGHESIRGSVCFKHMLIFLKMFHDL